MPGDADQPVSFTVLGAYQAPRRWQLSARFRLTSGQPYTPVSGVYDPTLYLWRSYQGIPNSARFPLFHQLDLRAEKTWERRKVDWSVYLDVFNATAARNPYAATYTYDYSEFVALLSIPLLPTLGATARF